MISNSKWGADHKTLKYLYTGYTRPTLEYGITSWGLVANTNFKKASIVQIQALRIINGGLKS